MVERRTAALLEREPELAELTAAIARAADRDGGAILLEGPAGIGKTELLAAARELAEERGMQVLAARGAELEREFAFGIARQLFEPLLLALDDEDRAGLLSGSAGLCEPVLGPEPPVSPSGGPGSAFAPLHGLYWLAVNASDRAPLVLSIDDLHWSDRPSLRFLEYLCGRLEGLPILVAAAFRPTEPGASRPVLASVAPGPLARRLELRPLSGKGSTALVRRELGQGAEEAFCRACHVAAAGNPLLLNDLIAALKRERIPPTEKRARAIVELGSKAASRTVQVRLATVPAAVERVARAAATLGEGASPRLVGRLAEVTEVATYEALEALHGLDILRREPRVEFVHPLIRAAIYEGLGPGERAGAHARAAELLDEAGEAPERIAAHLLLAPARSDVSTVATLRTAARRALAEGGAEPAVAYLRRALAEPPPEEEHADVMFELGSAELLIEGRIAAEHLERALVLTEDPERRAQRAELLARALFFAGRPDRAIEVAETARSDLGASRPELRRRIEATLLFAAIMDPARNSLAESLGSAVEGAGQAEDFGAKALEGIWAYREARACVPAARVMPRARRAIEGGALIAADNGGGAAMLAPLVLALADSELALPVYRAGLEAARRDGSLFGHLANKIFACQAHLLRGELADAIADGQEALDEADVYVRFEDPRGDALRRFVLPWPASFLAAAQIERGELEAAGATLALVAGPDEPLPNTHNWHWFLDARSRLRVADGDLAGGLGETLECGRRFESVGGRNPALIAWRSRAALCLRQLDAEPERARALVDEEVELARCWGAPRALGAALRARGLVVGGTGGLDALREAVRVLEPSPARLELARSLTDLGAAMRRSGDRSAAREPLRRALELAHGCGARPLAERAWTELRSTGARPRSLVVSGAESLTPSERRVAELGAGGLRNREIAQRLFVTQKTIEAHLRSVFRKLEIESRSQLAEALEGSRRSPSGSDSDQTPG